MREWGPGSTEGPFWSPAKIGLCDHVLPGCPVSIRNPFSGDLLNSIRVQVLGLLELEGEPPIHERSER